MWLLARLTSCVMVLAGSFALPASATDLSVDGTSFVLRQDGRTLRSTELIGAEIDLGEGHTLRIDGVRAHPDHPDILLHRFSVKQPGGDWQNPCSVDRTGHQEGFPLPGRWDADGRFHPDAEHFALTCTGGAQAKCVLFGYKPWKTAEDGRSLNPLYESCVRMVRADYCGDGQASTLDGTQIDIYDVYSVQASEADAKSDFRFEAGWTPQGAVCVNHTRIPANLSLEALVKRCPRLKDAIGAQCDEKEARRRGAVLFNKSR